MIDPMLLAGEWLTRLANPDRPAPMGDDTRRRLAEAYGDESGRRIIIAGMISPGMGAAPLARLADPDRFDAFLTDWNTADGWKPDRDALNAADRDLETIDASLAMRALVAWIARDYGRCAICLTGAAKSIQPTDAGAERALALTVAFAMAHGLAPAHGDMPPYPVPAWERELKRTGTHGPDDRTTKGA